MSEPCTIYGCIFAGGLIGVSHDFTFQHNKDVIEQLPRKMGNDRDFVISPMFSAPVRSDFPTDGFYRTQMIHFAASINHFQDMWKQWRNEFEDLLTKLYWHEAIAHVDFHLYGQYVYHWKAEIEPLFETPAKTIQKWEFREWPSSWEGNS